MAINGYGTIGKRVADAIDAELDMEIVGVTKARPSFGCDLAVRKGYPLFCTYDHKKKLGPLPLQVYDCKGGLSDLLLIGDVVVDCSPGKVGSLNKEICKVRVKWIFQGGEKHAMTEMSYTSSGNLEAERSRDTCHLMQHNWIVKDLVPYLLACGSSQSSAQ